MKLLRLGNVGEEIPAAIDKNGKYRNLSSHIKDFTPEKGFINLKDEIPGLGLTLTDKYKSDFKIIE